MTIWVSLAPPSAREKATMPTSPEIMTDREQIRDLSDKGVVYRDGGEWQRCGRSPKRSHRCGRRAPKRSARPSPRGTRPRLAH